MRTLFFILLLAMTGSTAYAQTPQNPFQLPPKEKQEVMKLALEGIWGNAIGRDGKKLQPLNEEQRTTIPVTSEVVDEAIRVGMINGMAFRCNVEWEPHFKLFMHGIRTIYTDDIPIAYATLVHGIMQGILGSGKETCDDQMKKNVTVLLERETKAYEDFLKINRKQLK